jgi:hypothetical protein
VRAQNVVLYDANVTVLASVVDVLVAWPIAFLIGVGVGLGLAGRGYRIVRTRNGKQEER